MMAFARDEDVWVVQGNKTYFKANAVRRTVDTPTMTAKLEPLPTLIGSVPVDQAPESVSIAETQGASQPLLCVICALVWHYTAMVFLCKLPGGLM